MPQKLALITGSLDASLINLTSYPSAINEQPQLILCAAWETGAFLPFTDPPKRGPEMDVKFYVEKCYDKPLEWLSGGWSDCNDCSSDTNKSFANILNNSIKHKFAT
jgi:hypothetical protein